MRVCRRSPRRRRARPGKHRMCVGSRTSCSPARPCSYRRLRATDFSTSAGFGPRLAGDRRNCRLEGTNGDHAIRKVTMDDQKAPTWGGSSRGPLSVCLPPARKLLGIPAVACRRPANARRIARRPETSTAQLRRWRDRRRFRGTDCAGAPALRQKPPGGHPPPPPTPAAGLAFQIGTAMLEGWQTLLTGLGASSRVMQRPLSRGGAAR